MSFAFFGAVGRMRRFGLVAFVSLLLLPVVGAAAQSLDKLEIVTATGAHRFTVEVVDDEASR